ncbi:hypothetical protein, partial [Bradyrhizobium liaoningense]|uniref:hypothetical protein n=1 Tax=Bradyrhizobium liaoningense TaxID=43992 RepID=UPI0024E18729
PSRRNDKTVKPRVQHNPAGIHLNPAGRCPNNRGQLWLHPQRRKIGGRCELRLPKQNRHANEKYHVQRKQDDVQNEDGVKPGRQTVADEREVAADCHRTQT